MRQDRRLKPLAAVLLLLGATVTAHTQTWLVCKGLSSHECRSWRTSVPAAENALYELPGEVNTAFVCGYTTRNPGKSHRKFITVESLNYGLSKTIFCKRVHEANSAFDWSQVREEMEYPRVRRQATFVPRGRYRGQTQSQYLSIDRGNGKDEGKAEAHSAADSSRASVSGNSGMGQAQSQSIYDPNCDDCNGKSDEAGSLRRKPGISAGGNGYGPGWNGPGSGYTQYPGGAYGPAQSPSPYGPGQKLYGPGQNGATQGGTGGRQPYGTYGPDGRFTPTVGTGSDQGPVSGGYIPGTPGTGRYGPGGQVGGTYPSNAPSDGRNGETGSGPYHINGYGKGNVPSTDYPSAYRPGSNDDSNLARPGPGAYDRYGPNRGTNGQDPGQQGYKPGQNGAIGGEGYSPDQNGRFGPSGGTGANYIPGKPGTNTYSGQDGQKPGTGYPGQNTQYQPGQGINYGPGQTGDYVPGRGTDGNYIPGQPIGTVGKGHIPDQISTGIQNGGYPGQTGSSYPGQQGANVGYNPGQGTNQGGLMPPGALVAPGTGTSGGSPVAVHPGQDTSVIPTMPGAIKPGHVGGLNTVYGPGTNTGLLAPGQGNQVWPYVGPDGTRYICCMVPGQTGSTGYPYGTGQVYPGNQFVPEGTGAPNNLVAPGTKYSPGNFVQVDSSAKPVSTPIGGIGNGPGGHYQPGSDTGKQYGPVAPTGAGPNLQYGPGVESRGPGAQYGPGSGTGRPGSQYGSGPGDVRNVGGQYSPTGQTVPGLGGPYGPNGGDVSQPGAKYTPGGAYNPDQTNAGGSRVQYGPGSTYGSGDRGGQYGIGGPTSPGVGGGTGSPGAQYSPGGQPPVGSEGRYGPGSRYGGREGTGTPIEHYGPGSNQMGPGGQIGMGPGGQVGMGPGGQVGMEPGGQRQVGMGPGGQYGMGPGGQGSVGPGGQVGMGPGGQIGMGPGVQGGIEPGGQVGVGPGGQIGMRPGGQGGVGPGGQVGVGPGGQIGMRPGGQGGVGPGGQVGMGPGGQVGIGPGGQGGMRPGGQPGGQGGVGPGGQIGLGPGRQGGMGPVGQGGMGPDGQVGVVPGRQGSVGPDGQGGIGPGGQVSGGPGGQVGGVPVGQYSPETGVYGPGGGAPGTQYGPGIGSDRQYGPNGQLGGRGPYGGVGPNAKGPSGQYGPGGQYGQYGPGGTGGGVPQFGPGDPSGVGGRYGPGSNGGTGPGGLYGPGSGVNGLGDEGQYTGGEPGSTYNEVPQNYVDPNLSPAADDDDSEAEAIVNQALNGTTASASSKGGNKKGRAQTHVQGTYTGSGSFQAQAQIAGENKEAESEVSGGKKGASSSATGSGRNNKSQASVQLGSETGSVQTNSQTSGAMHSSNSQVQGSIKGGMADAQARGPGSTSSQAQIGFTPYKDSDKSKHDLQKVPFVGGGMSSAQSSGRTGQSQSQLHGTFKYGISYNGAAQSGASLDKDAIFPTRLAFDKIDVFDANNKNINIDTTETPSESETEIIPETTPLPELPAAQEQGKQTAEQLPDETLSNSESRYHPHAEHHKYDATPAPQGSITENRRSFQNGYSGNSGDYEFTTDKDEGDDYDTEGEFASEGADLDPGEYSTYDEYSRNKPTHQSLQSPKRNGLEVRQTTGGNTQHIVLGSLKKHDAEITQKDSELPDEARVYQPGERVPGTGGYTIPIGFTGSVKSVASKDKTYVVGSKDSPSQAQSVTLTPGTGKIKYRYPSGYSKYVNPSNLRSLQNGKRDDDRYVSVSKSVTRALDNDNNIRKQYSHTYYTKSSSCGYFTFTCTMVSSAEGKKKVCKPKVPTNPDGTPIRC